MSESRRPRDERVGDHSCSHPASGWIEARLAAHLEGGWKGRQGAVQRSCKGRERAGKGSKGRGRVV